MFKIFQTISGNEFGKISLGGETNLSKIMLALSELQVAGISLESSLFLAGLMGGGAAAHIMAILFQQLVSSNKRYNVARRSRIQAKPQQFCRVSSRKPIYFNSESDSNTNQVRRIKVPLNRAHSRKGSLYRKIPFNTNRSQSLKRRLDDSVESNQMLSIEEIKAPRKRSSHNGGNNSTINHFSNKSTRHESTDEEPDEPENAGSTSAEDGTDDNETHAKSTTDGQNVHYEVVFEHAKKPKVKKSRGKLRDSDESTIEENKDDNDKEGGMMTTLTLTLPSDVMDSMITHLLQFQDYLQNVDFQKHKAAVGPSVSTSILGSVREPEKSDDSNKGESSDEAFCPSPFVTKRPQRQSHKAREVPRHGWKVVGSDSEPNCQQVIRPKQTKAKTTTFLIPSGRKLNQGKTAKRIVHRHISI